MNQSLEKLFDIAQSHPGTAYIWHFDDDEESCLLYFKDNLSEIAGGGSAIGYAVIAEIWEDETFYYQVVVPIGEVNESDPMLGMLNSEESAVSDKEFMRLSEFMNKFERENSPMSGN